MKILSLITISDKNRLLVIKIFIANYFIFNACQLNVPSLETLFPPPLSSLPELSPTPSPLSLSPLLNNNYRVLVALCKYTMAVLHGPSFTCFLNLI